MEQKSEDYIILRLTRGEAEIVRKTLQASNLIVTVAERDYHENNLDPIIKKVMAEIDKHPQF